jgi:hypothetical protein
LLEPGARGTLDLYKNVIVWIKAGITNAQIDAVVSSLNNLGVNIFYAYQSPANVGVTILILERLEIEKIVKVQTIPNVVNVKALGLDFGWTKSNNNINFNQLGTKITPKIISSINNQAAAESNSSSA